MKVFQIIPTNPDVVGTALIAADNANVAISMWKSYDEVNDKLWVTGECNCTENKELDAKTDIPKVLIDEIIHSDFW